MNAEQYIDSLRRRNLVLWVDGERIVDVVDHPKVRPAINAVAETYALSEDPEWRELVTAHSDIVGQRVNRFTHLFLSPDDLIKKLELQRLLGQRTGTCFQRCVGMDGLNATYLATFGKDGHERFVRWLASVQRNDLMLDGAMTDAKGDRSKRPLEQPAQFLRIVERRADGLVIAGAKMHQTGAANSHEILVMPGQALRRGEEDFAVACAVPVDAQGVSMVLGRQPSDERKVDPMRAMRALVVRSASSSSKTCSCRQSGCSSTAISRQPTRFSRLSPDFIAPATAGANPAISTP